MEVLLGTVSGSGESKSIQEKAGAYYAMKNEVK
jgi:hypothetical protein